jgi:hypothetical protein
MSIRTLCFTALTVTCLVAVVAGGIYAWSRFATLFFKQTEYSGLRLGTTMAETKYVKGVPTNVLEVEQAGQWQGWKTTIAINELEKGKKIEDYNEWSYEGIGHRTALVFDKNKLIAIASSPTWHARAATSPACRLCRARSHPSGSQS